MSEWTPARKKAFVVSALRAGSRKWPPRYETLNEAKTEKRINPKSNRLAQFYRCASCQGEFPAKDVNADHIKPCVDPQVGWVDWNTFVENLFCDKDNLQILCSECHTKKSNEERKKR